MNERESIYDIVIREGALPDELIDVPIEFCPLKDDPFFHTVMRARFVKLYILRIESLEDFFDIKLYADEACDLLLDSYSCTPIDNLTFKRMYPIEETEYIYEELL